MRRPRPPSESVRSGIVGPALAVLIVLVIAALRIGDLPPEVRGRAWPAFVAGCAAGVLVRLFHRSRRTASPSPAEPGPAPDRFPVLLAVAGGLMVLQVAEGLDPVVVPGVYGGVAGWFGGSLLAAARGHRP